MTHRVTNRQTRTLVRCLALAGCVLLTAGPALANDWPEWRGTGRLGVWAETGIVQNLPAELKVKWRVPVNSGFSGPAVVDGRVFVTDWAEDPASRTMDGTERAIALDEETGEILWTREWPTSYRMLMGSYAIGPRATPTVDGDRLYVVGAAGDLLCLDVETGEVIWEKHYIADFDSFVPTWGVTSGPIIDGDRLISIVGGEPGGLVMAFGQADRRGGVASARRGRGDGIRPADHHRGRRCAPADRVARGGAGVARSRDGRSVLGAAVGGAPGRVGRNARQARRLPPRVAVLPGLHDDAARPGPTRRDNALEGPEPE